MSATMKELKKELEEQETSMKQSDKLKEVSKRWKALTVDDKKIWEEQAAAAAPVAQ